jgi:hypothetical protein
LYSTSSPVVDWLPTVAANMVFDGRRVGLLLRCWSSVAGVIGVFPI